MFPAEGMRRNALQPRESGNPNVTSEERARQERAAKRAKVMVLHKTQLGRGEVDFTPVRGAAAISLATRLMAESFSFARLEPAVHSRQGIAVRFVPRTRA